MKPLDFYRLGLRLSTTATTEAEQRTVVSRLYYGLHHEACCRFFRENPDALPLPQGSRHYRMRERYGGQRTQAEQEVARLLAQIFAMRNMADYELRGTIQYQAREFESSQLMSLALIIAEDLLNALESFSPGEAPDGCDCPTQR